MFKGLQSTLQRVKTAEPTIAKHPDVTIIQPANILLAAEKRQQHLKNIKALLNLPPRLYDSLYHSVIAQFADFTQSLPETKHGLFSNEGGFLDHGLERAARALSLCLSYFFPQEKTFQNISSQEALWVYAVFTAALLLDVGKIAVKYHVHLCNKDGTTIKDWSPYTGPMIREGKFYRYDFAKENRDNLKRLVTSLVARQIIETPEIGQQTAHGTSGFHWIASDPDVLESWLTILHGEKRIPMTSFMSVIPAAEDHIIENYFANILPDQPSKIPNSIFDKPPAHDTLPLNMEAGDAFLHWLKEKVDRGEISINQPTTDSDIHVLEEGVLINPDLIQRFIDDPNKRFINDPTIKHSNPIAVKTEITRIMEVLFESPAELQRRYVTIQGISANLQKYILVHPMLAFTAEYRAKMQISQNLIVAPVQTVNIPASPPRAELPTPRNTPNLNV